MSMENEKKQFEQFKLTDGAQLVARRIDALSGPAREISRELSKRFNRKSTFNLSKVEAKWTSEAILTVASLPVAERVQVFDALFGPIGEQVELAWQRLGGQVSLLPYRSGHFRSPHDPELLASNRRWFLWGMEDLTSAYQRDYAFYLEWGHHFTWGSGLRLGNLFAAVIDAGGELGEVTYQRLADQALKPDTVGQMGHHVVAGLLGSAREEGWSAVEKLLLAAQRQEGLRQSILEHADCGYPGAYEHLLRLILEKDLLRFSSAARAVDVWFGQEWDATSTGKFRQILERVLETLNDVEARAEALKSNDAERVYFALWTSAYWDLQTAIPQAHHLLTHPKAEHRMAALYLLIQCPGGAATKVIRQCVADPEPRIALFASEYLDTTRLSHKDTPDAERVEVWDALVGLLQRVPADAKRGEDGSLPALLFPWLRTTATVESVANRLPALLGERHARELLPYLRRMSSSGRAECAGKLAHVAGDEGCREALLTLTLDRLPDVASAAFNQLNFVRLTDAEIRHFEAALTRTGDAWRASALALLLRQEDDASIQSAERLLACKNRQQRAGGLSLLVRLAEKDAATKARAQGIARAYRTAHPEGDGDEARLLDQLLAPEQKSVTRLDALGLIDPERLTRPRVMVDKGTPIVTPATLRLLLSLDAEIARHADQEVTVRRMYWLGDEKQALLLGNANWYAFEPDRQKSIAENTAFIPLAEAWDAWWESRAADTRDEDGAELLRAIAALQYRASGREIGWAAAHLTDVSLMLPEKLRHPGAVKGVLTWLAFSKALAEKHRDLILDVCETICARWAVQHLTPEGVATSRTSEPTHYDGPLMEWLQFLGRSVRHGGDRAEARSQSARYFEIVYWAWRPVIHDSTGAIVAPPVGWTDRQRLDSDDLGEAFVRGELNRDDLIFHLIGLARETPLKTIQDYPNRNTYHFHTLHGWTKGTKDFRALVARKPELATIVDQVRDHLLDLEIARGELPTTASPMAAMIGRIDGLPRLLQLLGAVKDLPLVRTPSYRVGSPSRGTAFSQLLRRTWPRTEDIPEAFAAAVKKAGIPAKRLMELAFLAPQWARGVEHALAMPSLHSCVLWYIAHTKDSGNQHLFQMIAEGTINDQTADVASWMAEVSEHTVLTPRDLADGAVDVAWFLSCVAAAGEAAWKKIHDAAKYATTGIGHARAKIFADAMLGRLNRDLLSQRIVEKRHQDSVRSLGLVPLATGEKRDADLLARYQVLQEFLRTGKQFGSMRQASEKRAVEIGLANLARTAGYADPVRLEWAMEAKSVEDLASGSISMIHEDVEITLTINPWGEPEITAKRGEKELREVPAKLKKDPEVKAFTQRKGVLKRQLSRMRHSLEAMMCRADQLSATDLVGMFANPLLRHMISQLVFINEDHTLAGYPGNGGRTLTKHDGEVQAIGTKDILRLAHPHDLLAGGEWSAWQRECFAHERIQPFKQVFRELYPVTPKECDAGQHGTHRYAGHQVNPKQALALLGGRGWVAVPEEGVRKTFHAAGVTVWLQFEEGFYSPAEIEGLTLESANFHRRDNGHPIPLREVDPLLFSETMRDLDLVVSVAHMGGVDPEASQSTVELRGTLAGETARLLRLGNVELKPNHAVITGQLATYSLHLGSGVIHLVPGGALYIVPVRSQHRGRLFLPFADSDPKTAEILSKLILLARDREIKDPLILDQIRKR